MPRPGVTITTSAASVAATPGKPLGTWLIAAQTQRGPSVPDPTRPLRSLGDYVNTYGTRDATLGASVTAAYDAVDAFFRTGGSAVLVARVVGPSAVTASRTLQDRAGSPINTLRVDAIGPGAWANSHLKVSVANGVTANTYVITILVDDVVTETSPELASPTDAVTWGASSGYVRIVDLASATAAPTNNPAVLSATALASGADDLASVTDTQWTNALNTGFPYAYGPGLVSKVGVSTAAGHAGTVAHAAANNRVALLDGAAGSSQGTLTTLAASVQSTAGSTSEYAALFAPWLQVPAASTGTSPRLVAPSSVAAGLISAQVTTGSPNIPAAGDNGRAEWVIDVQSVFTAAERDTLNAASPVNVFRRPYPASAAPAIELYGYNTLASVASGSTNSAWRQLSAQLMRTQLVHEMNLVGEQFVFDQIDGKGLKIAEFKGTIMGVLAEYKGAGSLWDFRVDTDSVNNATTIAAGELHARVQVQISPYGEFVTIDVVKTPINQSIAA